MNSQFGICMHVCVCEYMQYYAHTPAAEVWWSKRSISVSSKSHHRSLNKRDNVLIQEFKGGWVGGRRRTGRAVLHKPPRLAQPKFSNVWTSEKFVKK